VSQADFGIDDDVADYRVSVTALLLDTTGRPLAMAGGAVGPGDPVAHARSEGTSDRTAGPGAGGAR
ncbi:MAG: hypothetical protein AAGF02_20605, partial [Actinomycetota bacterium]